MVRVFKELYDYREMMLSLIQKELRGKYKGSVLGFFWSLLIPLFQWLIYTAVFSIVFRNENISDFHMFLFVALIPWFFFSGAVSGGALTILQQKNLVQKIYFPRMVLPIAYTISCFINMLLSFIIVFIALFISGIGVNIAVLGYLPLIMLIELLMGIGMALLFSALTVYFRDLEYILNIVTMAWMYMTPILYPLEEVEKNVGDGVKFLYLNPMTSVTIAYRDILYYKQAPAMETLTYAVCWGFVVLVIGFITFQRLQRHFVEEM